MYEFALVRMGVDVCVYARVNGSKTGVVYFRVTCPVAFADSLRNKFHSA